MDIARVIAQLKTYCPMLNKQVGGAAEYEKAMKNGYLSTPCAYVIPMADDAEGNTDSNGLTQIVTESVSVMLILDNVERRGQTATISVEATKYAVHKALLNWKMDPERQAKGFQYEGGSLVDMDGARLSWQMTYSRDIWLTDQDGFKEPSEPLLHITGHNEANTWSFDAALDQ
ncbi:phage tail terminator protein [Paracraurococcus lichenis]|uniref:Uncharacterized protein n=1 Tax=Paracraurococcus lichenis TaxID=3064888 RepID=A0ABT9EDK3_9PROT|nr:hypothetical protein [Paracraurococcus sp. LOR1-02]MDO9714302.1 hypothetical protein [Paracraurococcus sp. LOR1-02]